MNEQKNKHIGHGVAIMALVSITLAGAWAHWRYVSESRAALARMHDQIASQEQEISQSTAGAQLQKLEAELQSLDQMIPQRNEAARMIEQFSRTLAAMSLSQRSVTSGQPMHMQGLEQVPIHVRFSGSFESVFNVLRAFESSQPTTRLQQLVVRGDLAAGEQLLSVSAAFATFHRSGENTVAAVTNGAR